MITGTSGWRTSASPASSPNPCTIWTTPSGTPGLVQQVDEALRQQRRVLGRLQHDRVAANERRTELPRRDRDREVPRRDRTDDPHRHPDAHHELVAELRGRRLAEEAAPLAAHVVAHVDRFLDVTARLRLHLSHLARHQVGELGLALFEQLREAEEDVAALGRRNEAPVLPGGARGRDRAIDVGRRGAREGLDHLARGRVQRFEGRRRHAAIVASRFAYASRAESVSGRSRSHGRGGGRGSPGAP